MQSRFAVAILACALLAMLADNSSARGDSLLPKGTFNLQDPSTGQQLTLTIKAAPSITFSAIQPLQCGVTAAGAAVTTASLANGGANPTWSISPTSADFSISPTTGAVTVGANGLTSDICPAGGSVNFTVTANW